MNISFNLGALAKTKWYEYLVRFASGKNTFAVSLFS
jgi:hypothetical protein